MQHQKHHPSVQAPYFRQTVNQGTLNLYFQIMLTSSETCVTVEIADLIISEGMSLNIYRKHLFKEFLDLESNVSKSF